MKTDEYEKFEGPKADIHKGQFSLKTIYSIISARYVRLERIVALLS